MYLNTLLLCTLLWTATQHTCFCIYMLRTCVSFLQVKTYIHPVTGCEAPYVPMGRFIHIPPPFPRSDWANNFGRPWWTDSQYIVGTLTAKTRQIRIVNMVTLQEQVIEVCCVASCMRIIQYVFCGVLRMLICYKKVACMCRFNHTLFICRSC